MATGLNIYRIIKIINTKSIAGVPKLGKIYDSLKGVSLEIKITKTDAQADVRKNSWVRVPLPALISRVLVRLVLIDTKNTFLTLDKWR